MTTYDKLLLKRGTSDKCDEYAGSEGEIVYDKDNEAIRVYTPSTLSKGGKIVANLEDVPTKVSDIDNDKDYMTKADVIAYLNANAMTLDKTYPVGSIFINLNPIDPASILGGGVWERLDEGRVLIGANNSYESGSTGGEFNHVITAGEMASHTHNATADRTTGHTHTRGTMEITGAVGFSCYVDDEEDHTYGAFKRTTYSGNRMGGGYEDTVRHGFQFKASDSWTGATDTSGAHGHTVTVDEAGGNVAMSLMQPYLAVYMWKRIA